MNLPFYARALCAIVALSIAAAMVITVAEIGHPAPDGIGAIASLLRPQPGRAADVTRSAAADAVEP